MARYVLFTPIGRTDPTRGFHDGSFIHICRNYKPRKVYMYMSAEICHYDETDNRYELYLNKLAESLAFSCSVVKIKHKEIVDASDYDRFYEDFTDILRTITEENPNSKILLNLASGTPQMKMALQVVGNLSNRRLIQLQVKSPEGKSNDERAIGTDFDIDFEWELNNDNKADYKNRCIEVKSENFNALIKKEIITKHIRAYDYRAALSVADSISDYIPTRAAKLIKAGYSRLALDVEKAEKLAKSEGFMIHSFTGNETNYDQLRIAYEYILNLQIKMNKGELADFLRAISPVLTDLFEIYLQNICLINIKDYYVETGTRYYKTLKLSKNLLPQDLRLILESKFNDKDEIDPLASVLLPIITCKGAQQHAKLASELRNVESRARNVAAHEVIAVNEVWIHQKTGYTSAEILNMLKEFLSICTPIPDYAWNSYDQLNSEIIKAL